MTLTTIPLTYMPERVPDGATSPFSFLAGGASHLMDASGEKTARVFIAPKTGNIHKVYVRFGNVTTPVDTDIRIETVDLTTGAPSGTLWGTNTNGTILSASVSANTERSVTLTADAAVTKGQMFCIVMAPSGTPNFNIDAVANWDGAVPLNFPPSLQFTSSWGKVAIQYWMFFEYDDGEVGYVPQGAPFSSFTNQIIGTGSNPDEVALKFTAPVRMRVTGWWAFVKVDGDMQVRLIDSDGTTVLSTAPTVDADTDRVVHSNVRGLFTDTVTLTKGSVYYLVLTATTATSFVTQSVNVSATGLWGATMGSNGANWHYASRVDAGAWTAVTTRRLLAGLIIDQVDDGTGSGSGSGANIPSIGD